MSAFNLSRGKDKVTTRVQQRSKFKKKTILESSLFGHKGSFLVCFWTRPSWCVVGMWKQYFFGFSYGWLWWTTFTLGKRLARPSTLGGFGLYLCMRWLATHNRTFYIFLSPQSGALSRRAFRDTIPIPVPLLGLIWNIPRQTKADHRRPLQNKAGTVRYRRVQKSVPKQCPQKGSQKTPYRFQDFSLTFSYKIHIHGKYQSKGCRCRWYPRCYCHLRCFIKSLNSAVGKWWDWTMSITQVKAGPGNQLWLDYSARFFSILGNCSS